MKRTPRFCGAWVDLLGYDASLPHSVIIDNPKPTLHRPVEMVVTCVPVVAEDDSDETRKHIM